MSIEFEIEGLDELMNEFEKLASEEALKSCLDSCLKSIAQEVKSYASTRMARSADVTRSGRIGSRTYQHSADNIPISKIKKRKGYSQVTIGWDKTDTSPYFYVKFTEYGTSKIRPRPVLSVCKTQFEDKFTADVRTEIETKIANIMG